MKDRNPRAPGAASAQIAEKNQGISRRGFVKSGAAGLAAVAGASASLFGGKAPAFAQSRELHILEWSSFIKPVDKLVDMQAAEFGKQEGIRVRVEHINANNINARATAAVESGSGPDLIRLLNNQPHLYAPGIIDHSDLVQEVGGNKIWPFLRDSVNVDGVYRGVPNFGVGAAWVYRKDIFKQAGAKVPNTWEDLLESGKKLKAMDYPIGQSLGHSFGDPNGFAYVLLWSFGGALTDKSGRKVVINSSKTRDSVNFVKEFWNATCDEGGLAWDDGSNNRAYLGDQISTTLNGASIYFVAKRDPSKSVVPNIAEKSAHFLNPAGPHGRHHTLTTFSASIMKHSKVQSAAKNYIRYFLSKDQFSKFMWENNGYVKGITKDWQKHGVWETDSNLTAFRDMAQYGRTFGYPGPYTRESSELLAKFIVVDMFARAVKGQSTNATVLQAERDLKQIYG